MIGAPTTISDVVDRHLCTGCGVCAFLEPESFRMTDIPSAGRRPLPVASVNSGAGSPGIAACPGRALTHPHGSLDGAPFGGAWGQVLALYECWATDPNIRHRGSSGGVVTALAAHAVTSGSAVGVLQVQASTHEPLVNETVLNRTYDAIVAAAGSRYSPASPCERLDLVTDADGPCVVVGKPCDIAATKSAATLREDLAKNLALTIGIFCAGTPSTHGTMETLKLLDVAPSDVARLDYRGEGWPGEFRVRTRAGDERSMSYRASWGGPLQKNRQWRCMICPDHTGEFADLSVGDPWYRPVEAGEPGRSLVIVRTIAGHGALLRALADGALEGNLIPLARLRDSQPHLEATRGAVWARIIALRLAAVKVPKYRGFPSVRLWWQLPVRQKVSSFIGTWRRVSVRHLRKPEFSRADVRA